MQNANNSMQRLSIPKQFNAEVQKMKIQLRNTRQYSEIFYSIITNTAYPPCFIECTKDGVFWTRVWEDISFNYEPFSTAKIQNCNVDAIVVCAIFQLVQESYPNVYTFPTNTLSSVEAGTDVYRLIMAQNFYGVPLQPVYLPPTEEQLRSNNYRLHMQAREYQSPSTQSKICCTKCGNINPGGSRFCSVCGNRLQ